MTRPGARLPFAPLVVLRTEATLRDVARVMRRTGVSAVSVGDSIITKDDLVDALAQDWSVATPALRAAAHPPVVVRSTQTVCDALVTMIRHEVQQLVVTDDAGVPVGLVTMATLFRVALGEQGGPGWLEAFRLALGGAPIADDVWRRA